MVIDVDGRLFGSRGLTIDWDLEQTGIWNWINLNWVKYSGATE